MNKYYVLWNGGAWVAKDGEFFESQGGLKEEWGKDWIPIYADSLEHARDAAKLRLVEGKLLITVNNDIFDPSAKPSEPEKQTNQRIFRKLSFQFDLTDLPDRLGWQVLFNAERYLDGFPVTDGIRVTPKLEFIYLWNSTTPCAGCQTLCKPCPNRNPNT